MFARSDGKPIKDLDVTQRIEPYFIKSRQAASIQVKETLDITRTLQYIKQHNASGSGRYSVFIVLLAALVRTGVLHPQLNRFVAGKRVYAHNKLQVSFVAKQQLNEEGKEMVLKLSFDPADCLADVAAKVSSTLLDARKRGSTKGNALIATLLRMPSFLLTLVFVVDRCLDSWGLLPACIIESDPLFSSAFVANLGSLGLGAPYHPLYERGTISLFVVLGEYKKGTELSEDGQPRDYVDLSFTVDSRIAGGYSIAQALHTLKKLVENPELLNEAATEVLP